jgi:hypothetical protein
MSMFFTFSTPELHQAGGDAVGDRLPHSPMVDYPVVKSS